MRMFAPSKLNNLGKTMQSDALDRLTALRGAAALMVAVGHSLMVLSVEIPLASQYKHFQEVSGIQSLITRILLAVFNGNSAVILFFVLSGFVLGLSLDRSTGGPVSTYCGFVVRRAFRIYPTLILSLLCVGAVMPWLVNLNEAIHGTAWFNSLYRSPFSIEDLGSNLLLMNTDMNPVCWTLRVELMVALVLPPLHALTRKTGAWCDLLLLMLLGWLSVEYAPIEILKWTVAFYFGLVLTRWGGWIADLGRTSPWEGRVNILLAITAFLWPAPMVYGALSACVLIACLVYGPDLQWFRCLDVRWLRLLGQVSYSFYLVHLIILYCMARGVLLLADTGMMTDLPPLALNMLLAAFSCLVAIVLARLIFVWIETPFMLLGKRISARLGTVASWSVCRPGNEAA